eukprot:INCI2368.1.p1 GENE.INCI2368.1~~INCI2368.1.p1  ORF type:complete len:173 (-),score=49.91 INCI2368.1:158-676(-)
MSVDAVEKRLGYLAKSLDMNSDAVALLMHKAESLRGLLQMQSLVTAETGVSQKYQEKIDELAGQVDDYKYALEFVAKEKQKIQQDDQVHALESQLGSLQEDKASLKQALEAERLQTSTLKSMLELAAQQDEENATETEEMLDRLAEENSQLKSQLRKLMESDGERKLDNNED